MHSKHSGRRLRFEQLEGRRVLSTNPIASASLIASTAAATTPKADLHIAIVQGPQFVSAGDDFVLKIAITNNGLDAAQNVKLGGIVPSGATLVSQSQTAGPAFTLSNVNGQVIDTIKTWPSGQVAAFTFKVTVPISTPKGTVLSAVPTLSSTTVDPYPADNSIKIMTTVAVDSLGLSTSGIVPDKAPDLKLKQIFGGEAITIPITLKNGGSTPVSGQVEIETRLSKTPDLSGTSDLISTEIIKDVNIGGTASTPLTVHGTIPGTPVAGEKYYFIAKVISSDIKALVNKSSASTSQFEFVGVVTVDLNAFQAKYFDVIRKSLNSSYDPFANQGVTPDPTTGKLFTAAFEATGGYDKPKLATYLDSAKPIGHPTIGIGLNLDSIASDVAAVLATDVKAYYAKEKKLGDTRYNQDISKFSPTQIVALLKADIGTGKNEIEKADAQLLFDKTYAKANIAAQAFVGGVTANTYTVLADIAFNAGGGDGLNGFTKLKAALQAPSGPDYLRAGFELINSKRAVQQVGTDRSVADYRYLFNGVSP